MSSGVNLSQINHQVMLPGRKEQVLGALNPMTPSKICSAAQEASARLNTLPTASTLHPLSSLLIFSIFSSSLSLLFFSLWRKAYSEGSGRGEMEWVGRNLKERENEKGAITDRDGERESMGRWEGRRIYEWVHRENECWIWERRN